MTSKVGILNLAFNDLGGQSIVTFGENSKEGRLSEVYWDDTLKSALEAHTWDFAKKWANLAEDANYTFVDSEWSYAYQIPSDFVRFSSQEDLSNL